MFHVKHSGACETLEIGRLLHFKGRRRRRQTFRRSRNNHSSRLSAGLNDRQTHPVERLPMVRPEWLMTRFTAIVDACDRRIAGYLKPDQIIRVRQQRAIRIDGCDIGRAALRGKY